MTTQMLTLALGLATVAASGCDDPPAATTGATASPEAPATAGPEPGKAATDATYSVWLEGGESYAAGKPATVQAVIVPKDGYKCNDEYPFKFKGSPSDGVTFPEEVARDASVSPERTTLSIPFVPARAGEATVSGTLSFSVCTEENCIIKKAPLAVKVKVD
jgi:hypothetical protein